MTLPEKINTVKGIINNHFDVDINVKTRKREFVHARRIYYKWMKENTKMSLKKISETLTKLNQDHSTIIHAIEMFDDQYYIYLAHRNDWKNICNKIREFSGEGVVVENEFSYAFNPS